MATTAELEAALINADKAGDQDAARQLAAAIGHAREQGQNVYVPPAPKLGIVGNIKEAITGDLRQTDTTNALPDWASMPEMQHVSVAGLKAALGTMASNPKETAQIMKANFPNIQVTQDEKGNFIFTSAQDGKQYALKPGFQVSDIPRAIGQIAAFTPAGRAETLLGAAATAGATQAAIEGTQAATGGEFDPKEVAVAAATGPLAPILTRAAAAAKPLLRRATDTILGRGAAEAPDAATVAANAAPSPTAAAAPVAAVETPVASAAPAKAAVASEAATAKPAIETVPEGKAVWKSKDADYPVEATKETHTSDTGEIYQKVIYEGKPSFVPAKELTPVVAPAEQAATEASAAAAAKAAEAAPQMSATDLAATTKKAAEGGMGSNKATQILAEQAAPDAKTVDAAKRINMDGDLQTDHVTTNQAYRELTQVLKSVPGSQLGAESGAGLQRAAQKADSLIEQLGGSKDLSELNSNIKNELQASHDKLKASAKKLYDEIDGALVKTAKEAPAPNVLEFVKAHAKELGGEENLSAGEKMILEKLAPKEVAAPVPTIPKNGRMSAADFKAMNEAPKTTIKQPTYALLDKIRKEIGAAKRGASDQFGNADTKLLGDLENALRADQGAAAAANGLGEKWQAAQVLAKQYKGIQDDMVALFSDALDKSIVGNLNIAVKSLPSGDVAKLAKLIRLTPDSMKQQLVASGLLNAFRKNTIDGSLNFNMYAKWYEGLLRNKQAHALVMANLPKEARKQLSDLYRVSKGISLSEKEYIATGRIQSGIDAIKESFKPAESLIDRVYDVARRGAAGAVAGTVVTPILGPGVGAAVASALTKPSAKTSALKAADALIASPEFAEAVKKAAAGQTKQAAARLAYSAPFKKFARVLNQPKEMTNREKWIMQALEANNQTKSNGN